MTRIKKTKEFILKRTMQLLHQGRIGAWSTKRILSWGFFLLLTLELFLHLNFFFSISSSSSRSLLPSYSLPSEIRGNDSDFKPIFVLHIGPHKTATSTIQCELMRYKEELSVNASIEYLGRRSHPWCLSPNRNGSSFSAFSTRELIDKCFGSKKCKIKKIWKQLEKQLEDLSNRNKSVILSDEAFSRMRIHGGDNVNNQHMLYTLANQYFPGRVHVVIVYRRYFEWIVSMWNSVTKPYLNDIKNPKDPYKPKFKKWPSEGGETGGFAFDDIISKKILQTRWGNRTGTNTDYHTVALSKNLHPAEYLRRLWSNYSSQVVILNMHKIQHYDGEDITTHFIREILPPLAGDTLVRAKENNSFGNLNPSKNFDYDTLVVKAHKRGLLVNQTTTRSKVSEITEEYLLKKLNTTKENLPLVCLNEKELQNFLQISLEYEHQLYPDQSEEATWLHESAFFEAVKRKKFCNIDTDKLIEDHIVQEFFTVDIPRLSVQVPVPEVK